MALIDAAESENLLPSKVITNNENDLHELKDQLVSTINSFSGQIKSTSFFYKFFDQGNDALCKNINLKLTACKISILQASSIDGIKNSIKTVKAWEARVDTANLGDTAVINKNNVKDLCEKLNIQITHFAEGTVISNNNPSLNS